jgi:HlyD family secretion protein
VAAQLAAQTVQIEKLKAAWELKKQQVMQLKVRAGAAGVLQQMAVEVGQKVLPGAVLAKVAQPTKLKAELKIAETQTKDILIGQAATIDTRNGLIPGHVSRIDPAAINGTVTVDVKLDGALPAGARPDLSVDGTVDLERIADVVFVGRPVYGQPHSTITLFKLVPGTDEAVRVPVKLGRASVNHIEVVEGLSVGDTVLLSDMSQHDSQNRIKLKK